MSRVPVRELNQHTAEVLARVERGERVEITRHGTPVAIIEPVLPDPLTALIDAGELRPGSGALPLIGDDEPVADDDLGSDAVRAEREADSRW